jgi:hypothetical protein
VHLTLLLILTNATTYAGTGRSKRETLLVTATMGMLCRGMGAQVSARLRVGSSVQGGMSLLKMCVVKYAGMRKIWERLNVTMAT